MTTNSTPLDIAETGSKSRFSINQKQFKAKIKNILNDDSSQREAIERMESIFREKRLQLYKHKNFVANNVEKSIIWKEINEAAVNGL